MAPSLKGFYGLKTPYSPPILLFCSLEYYITLIGFHPQLKKAWLGLSGHILYFS